MTLLYDMARCHDTECPLNVTCARFQQRDTAGATTVHVQTLRAANARHCDSHLHIDDFKPAGKQLRASAV